MAVTTLIPIGPPFAASQTTIYALPARSCILLSDVLCEVSNSTNTGFVVAPAATTTGGQIVAAQFIRCTTGAAVVSLKAQ